MESSSVFSPLISDHKRYEAAYNVYRKRARIVQVLEDWINSYFTEKITKTMSLKNTEELTVLAVGSGSGQDESKVLKQLLTKWPKIKDTVVEPNLGHISRYQDLAAKESRHLSGVSFDWRNQTLQQFRRETSGQQLKYHFIMLFHMLYFMDDLEEVLKYMMSILADGGIILVMIGSDDSCMAKMQNMQQNQNQSMSTRHIEQILTANQIHFVRHEINYNLDATGCFDDNSEEGELLIEFFTQTAYLKKQASESQYNDIINHVKSVILPSDDNSIWFRCDCDAIVITK